MSNEADDIDRATTNTLEFTAAAVDEARRRAGPQQKQNEDGTWPITVCVDCDTPIIPERLAMARIRCVTCQELEDRHRRFLR